MSSELIAEFIKLVDLYAERDRGYEVKPGSYLVPFEMLKAVRDRVEPLWWRTKDGDAVVYDLFTRHYSAGKNRSRAQRQFVGPGEHIVLRTLDGRAAFVWRKFIDASGQQGVNCAFFRNEGEHTSSELIRQADAVADLAWPGERHYTYVDAGSIRSTNPGFCFLKAGWRRCGVTKKLGLVVLERE